MKTIDVRAKLADDKLNSERDSFAEFLCSAGLSKIQAYSRINLVCDKAVDSESYSKNSYFKDFKVGSFLSKRKNICFDSAREAQLFDVLYDFFGGEVSDNKIVFIIDLLKNYKQD